MRNMASLHSTAIPSLKALSRAVPAVSALALSLAAGVWMLNLRPGAAPTPVKASIVSPTPAAARNPNGPMLVDLGLRTRAASVSTPEKTEVEAKLEPMPMPSAPAEESQPSASADGDVAPLPPRRPAELKYLGSRNPAPAPAAARQSTQRNVTTALAAPPADDRSFLEKFFGGAASSTAQQPSRPQPGGQALAYAAPETGLKPGLFGGGSSAAPNPAVNHDRYTAVYDISAHMVYMPDGTKLEAHSGLGSRLDDPRYVHERMHGPTPPHVYYLSPREALFHGVEALRLTPIGGGNIFGRAGLLAHTFMLGPKGDSNGCVSFRNYDAFLQAYKKGEVKRLVVVAHL